MFKAIFFDWFNTLACYKPPREELYNQALQAFGIQAPVKEIRRGMLLADKCWYEENATSPVEERNPEAQIEVYTRYQSIILNEAGVSVPRELVLKIMKKVQQLFQGLTFVLFDDVLPALRILKERNLILGLLTNLARDMVPICYELGLDPCLDFVVTPKEVGADKPKSLIFLAALERAGVKASEAVHVGDQYELDVVGARRVGITPILMDRYDLYPGVSDCPRIHSMTELPKHL